MPYLREKVGVVMAEPLSKLAEKCKSCPKSEKCDHKKNGAMRFSGFTTIKSCKCYTRYFDRQYVTCIEGRNKKSFKSISVQRRIRKSTK